MAERIYDAGDIEGHDFAFDAVANHIDWSRVVDAAQDEKRRLTLSLAMLFTDEGEVDQRARTSVTIPEGSDEYTVRKRVYAAIRNYIRNVGVRLGLDEDETPSNAVALISAVSMSS